ncbi:hypothetical protein HK101_009585 [Irineochytrium annulatum]|nr:hypothetical protein HK101_009585 [Irineochytrium annulatum]
MDINATAAANGTLDSGGGGGGGLNGTNELDDGSSSWFQPIAIDYTAGVNACSLAAAVVGVALLLLCWQRDGKFFERISLRIVMVLMVDNVFYHINYIWGMYLVTNVACQANVLIYVFFDVFRTLMTAALAFHLFYICVLKRTVHRYMFEAYLISAAILSVGIALPSYFLDAVYFSPFWGCWYNSAEVAWIFYYGPLMVPCLTALILALAVRISMMEHLKLSNSVGSIRTTNVQTSKDAVNVRPCVSYRSEELVINFYHLQTETSAKSPFSFLLPESQRLLPLASDAPTSDVGAAGPTIRRSFFNFSPAYPPGIGKVPAKKTSPYRDESGVSAGESSSGSVGHTIVMHEMRSPSIQPLLPSVPGRSSSMRKPDVTKEPTEVHQADENRSAGTIGADAVMACAPATHPPMGCAGAGVVSMGGSSVGGSIGITSSGGWGADGVDGIKAARIKRRETVRKLEKKYSKPFGLADADKLSD